MSRLKIWNATTGQYEYVGGAALAALNGTTALTTTPVKTGTYAAAANELVRADATSAGFTVTLPTAPADKSRVTVKKTDATVNVVMIACAGSDVFNIVGGGTMLTLTLQNQAITFQYSTTGAVWVVSSDDLPLTPLQAYLQSLSDSRYATIAEPIAVANLATATSRSIVNALIFGS